MQPPKRPLKRLLGWLLLLGRSVGENLCPFCVSIKGAVLATLCEVALLVAYPSPSPAGSE
jgi:hypothetical protein